MFWIQMVQIPVASVAKILRYYRYVICNHIATKLSRYSEVYLYKRKELHPVYLKRKIHKPFKDYT
jgi:hypothetical protein